MPPLINLLENTTSLIIVENCLKASLIYYKRANFKKQKTAGFYIKYQRQ